MDEATEVIDTYVKRVKSLPEVEAGYMTVGDWIDGIKEDFEVEIREKITKEVTEEVTKAMIEKMSKPLWRCFKSITIQKRMRL